MIVGAFDLERRVGQRITADELNRILADYCAENGLRAQRQLTESDLARVREKRAELFAKWESVRPGDALEISF
jgi:hypothetical protein